MNQTATLAAPQPRVLADVSRAPRVRDAALVLGAALLTAACAQISIPFPGSPVPVTGQTFAVLLTGARSAPTAARSASCSTSALGLVGLPFYADGAHGVDVVFGATGGYLRRVPDRRVGVRQARRGALRPHAADGAAGVHDRLADRLRDRRAVAGRLRRHLAREAIELGFVPFIPGGILKAALAAGLLPRRGSS